jgi:OOP family OmpA-OmpF porin
MKSNAKAGLIAAGLAAVVFAGPALAQQRADSGIYIGASFGTAEQKDQCSGASAPGLTCDNKDSAWKLFGGYQFNRYLAAEIGYTDLGEASAAAATTRVTDKATAFEVVGLGMLPVIDRLSIFGKLGFYRGELKRTSNNPLVTTGTNSQNDVTFGVGVRFDITHNLGVRAEWQRYTDLGEITDVDVMSIGVQFKF